MGGGLALGGGSRCSGMVPRGSGRYQWHRGYVPRNETRGRGADAGGAVGAWEAIPWWGQARATLGGSAKPTTARVHPSWSTMFLSNLFPFYRH
jgi:hypothetical protein